MLKKIVSSVQFSSDQPSKYLLISVTAVYFIPWSQLESTSYFKWISGHLVFFVYIFQTLLLLCFKRQTLVSWNKQEGCLFTGQSLAKIKCMSSAVGRSMFCCWLNQAWCFPLVLVGRLALVSCLTDILISLRLFLSFFYFLSKVTIIYIWWWWFGCVFVYVYKSVCKWHLGL